MCIRDRCLAALKLQVPTCWKPYFSRQRICLGVVKPSSRRLLSIEGTLREFARFDPVNLWFDYPVHKLDSGLLEDLQPESDYKQLGSRGAAKRWGDKDTAAKSKRAELRTAFEACTMDGKVTIYSMAEYLNLKPDTVRRRLKSDGGFWIDGTSVGLKEPGSNG